MTDLVELAYTMLLGWMRTLVDWFWSIFSGTGNNGAWNWFLSNWKIWLTLLLVGGLVVDWLMWVVRWRPYRLLTSRLRPGKKAASEPSGETWDSGVGYYATETAADSEPMDWKETTFATLSEVDPNWAGNVRMETYEDGGYDDNTYTHDYESARLYDAQDQPPEANREGGQWDGAPDAYTAEPESVQNEYPDDTLYEPAAGYTPSKNAGYAHAQAAYTEPEEDGAYAEETFYPDDDDGYADDGYEEAAPHEPVRFDPFAPYDAYAPNEVPSQYAAEDVKVPPREDTGPVLYGRPGYWPGMQYPRPGGTPESAPGDAGVITPQAETPEAYDPLFNPDTPQTDKPRRRRRRLREQTIDDLPRVSAPDPETDSDPFSSAPLPDWLEAPQNEAPAYPHPLPPRKKRRTIPGYVNQRDEFADTRPSRIVQPSEPPPMPPEPRKVSRGEKLMRRMRGDNVKTVTGKPAKPRGIRRFTSLQDDAISGLPPLDLTNPFMPVVHPDDIDFAPDEGREFNERQGGQ